jgi:diguanylate cyclase (GGDEF)-like protein/PAS domain S-box-containing protein
MKRIGQSGKRKNPEDPHNDITEESDASGRECIGQDIIDSAMDAIVVIDESQNIVQFNASAERVFGYRRSDVLGRSIHILVPEHLRASHHTHIKNYGKAAITKRQMHSLIVRTGKRANGQIFPMEASLTYTLVNGKKYFAAILRDVSERESLEGLILRQYESLNTLHLITLGLLNRRNIKELLQFIVDESVKLLDISYCEILMPDGDELVAQAFTHEDPFENGNRFKREEGNLSWSVFDTGLPVVLEDYALWPYRHKFYDSQDFHATAAIPLLVDEQCIGVMGLTRDKPGYKFSEEQILVASRLAAIAALALENSRLYLEVEKLATLDELTGVPNRRSLIRIGEAEVERAIRYGRQLSLLMLDIDHFKRINDTWGHAAGDWVLHKVAQEAVTRLRKTDAVGRFDQTSLNPENVIGRLGGEEFCVLLPETSREQALQVAERLRSCIEKLTFEIPRGKTSAKQDTRIQITVSIGISSLMPGLEKLSELFSDADQALYRAKETGRNRVCVTKKTALV